MMENPIPGALEIWLHPRRTAALMEELAQEKDNLLRQTGEQEESIAELRSREKALLDRLSEKEVSIAAFVERTDRLETELATVRLELSDRKSTEEQLTEFDRWIERVEKLKQDYETRISGLQSQIQQLRRRLESGLDSELAEIDMRGSIPENGGMKEKKAEEDWLDPLPLL